MLTTRVIARLDVKPPNVVKGRRMDGLRVMGTLYECAQMAQEQGADELLYVDIVASLYGRGPNGECIEEVSRDLTIPLTVCGGIRSLDDVRMVMRLGADKVGINTVAATGNLDLLQEIAKRYGDQSVVLSIEAKKVGTEWIAYTHGGREPSAWKASSLATWAPGEILLTSVDHDGCGTGGDLDLIRAVRARVPNNPLIYSGGIKHPVHAEAALMAGADAVAIASEMYLTRLEMFKNYLATKGHTVRT